MKLNIGAGQTRLDEFLNVDIDPACEPDILADITKGISVEDNVAEEIRMYGVIEHFSLRELREKVLPEILRILKPGGFLEVLIPDLETLARRYIKFLDTGATPHKREGIGTEFLYDGADLNYWILGAQMTQWDLHKVIFDSTSLRELFIGAGFLVYSDSVIHCDHNLIGKFGKEG